METDTARCLVAWSSCKDCPHALQAVWTAARLELAGLDPRPLPTSFAGHTYDVAFLRDLPDHLQPCGEDSELRSFAVAGPVFSS